MRYPVIIEKDGTGYLATFPDIPEALAGGDTYEEALAEARDALVTAFEFYIEDQRPIPLPKSKAKEWVEVPISAWAKVLLLNTMLAEGLSQSELARRVGTTKQEMQRIIDLKHATKIDTINHAMTAMGHQFSIAVVSGP